MKKILHVYRTSFPETQGGIEQVIKNLSKGLNELNHDVRILSLSKENKNIVIDGVEVYYYKRDFSIKSNCFSFSMLINAREHFEWADVINFHYPWPSGDLLSFFISRTKPIVVTYHSDIIRQRLLKFLYRPLEKFFLNKACRIYPTSENYLNSSQTLIPYKGRCEVIPLGIDFEEYRYVDTDIERRYEEKFGRDFFLFVGVLRYYKGLKYLLEAAKHTGYTVVIAGKGPEEASLKEYVDRNNLKNVFFLGFVSEAEKNALLSLCKCFVFPSCVRTEAFGVSLIEALFHGKPIISCEISTGTSFVNLNEHTGIVIPPSDSLALANAMKKIEASDLESMSDNAKKRALEYFSYKKMAKKYSESYEALTNNG